jgi:hypothetical protein
MIAESLAIAVALGRSFGSSYLGCIECPPEIGIIREGPLHAVYNTRDIGLSHRDDLD